MTDSKSTTTSTVSSAVPKIPSALDDPEDFPDASTLHYVLNTPIKFKEDVDAKTGYSRLLVPAGLEYAVFATGCFWGSEKRFWRMPGVVTTAVGYTAGLVEHPIYDLVCEGTTRHAECVLVVWDPTKVSFADLIRIHFESHNPTAGDSQGNDVGTQYRSGVYYTRESQRLITLAALEVYQAEIFENGYEDKITTEVAPLKRFYYAERYHQQYLAKPNSRQYCSAQPLGIAMPAFEQWGSKLLEKIDPSERALVGPPKLPAKFWELHSPKTYCSVTKDPVAQITFESLL